MCAVCRMEIYKYNQQVKLLIWGFDDHSADIFAARGLGARYNGTDGTYTDQLLISNSNQINP